MDFSLRTHAQNRSYSQPHFFVLSKGDNAGRPMVAPRPNCFVLTTNSEEEKILAYWICYCLWQSRQFSRFMVGSVIPFLTVGETSKLISETIRGSRQTAQAFTACVRELEKIQSLERNLCCQLAKVKALKSKLATACLAARLS